MKINKLWGLFIFSIFFIVAVFTNPSHTKAAGTCNAATIPEFKACLAKAKTGQTDVINITANITCTEAAPCDFIVAGVTVPLMLRGTSPTAGFTRSGGYKYKVIMFTGNSKVVVRDLIFRDATNIGCKSSDAATCSPIVQAWDATNVVFHNLSFLDVNRVALELNSVNKANEYTVQNSTFRNTGLHPINASYAATAPKGGVYKILNNTIENSKSSAMNFNVNSSASRPSVISGNIISHTHYTPMYFTCWPHPNGQCSGGQVFIYAPTPAGSNIVTENVIVEKNLIQNGITNTGIYVWGVEVYHDNVRDIQIKNNVIIDQNSAIYLSSTPENILYTTQKVTIADNFFANSQNIPSYTFYAPGILNLNTAFPPTLVNNNTSLTRDQAFAKFTQIRPPAPPAPAFAVVTNTPAPTIVTSAKTGDTNGDGVINVIDIGVVIDNYGKIPITNTKADVNHDNSVNIIDTGIIIDNYGK